MQFTTAFLASAAALTASALPQSTPIADGTAFGVITIHSGSDIQNQGIQALKSSLVIGAENQGASCDAQPASNFATFYIQDGELNLLESKSSARGQKVYVDRSGMGMGKIGYVTGAQPTPKNGETKGWAIENNELKFDGTSIQACPSTDGEYSIWLAGVEKPAYIEGCVGALARVVKADNPAGCWYSE